MSNGANPVKAVTDNLASHIEEKKAERAKVIAQLHKLNEEIALAETLVMMVPELNDPARHD